MCTTLAVRFRIPDEEQVSIGKYNEPPLVVTAAKSISIAQNHNDSLGLEVIIPRTILPKEIIKIYKPPKVVGWRYYPGAHGKTPCSCDYCQRGQPFSQKLRRRYKQMTTKSSNNKE